MEREGGILRIRKASFFPLNYGTDQFPILELRIPIAKRKQAGNSRRFAEQELL